jgi:tetratricopeptide (TPR) repeat protein
MSTSIHFRRLLGGAACILALSACTTAPVVKPTVGGPTIADVMGKAAAADSAGQKEAAMTLWKQAAVAYPADKDPWTRMAQTKYEAGQYGEAIVNAQEILVRDPNDQLANSIIAISGLRLSTRALADLSRQNNLSGSLRTESQDLAKLLRESLGETVLVPPARDKGVQPPPRNTGVVKKGGKLPARESKADPFDALK